MYVRGKRICCDQRYETLMVVRALGNYTAAGSVLCLTPSAVSHQIRSMEQELGFPLFAYDGKKLLPTKECDIIGEYVSRIRLLETRLDGDLSHAPTDRRRLIIGATPSTQESVLTDILNLYRDKHPETQITLYGGNIALLESMLCNHAIDLAVAEGEINSDQIRFIVLDSDCLVIAVPNDSSYVAAGGITLQQLRKEKLIMRAGNSGTRMLFDASIKNAGLTLADFRIMMELEDISTIKKLVAKHYGVSVLSQKACMNDVQQGLFCTVPLIGVQMVRTIRIFYHEENRSEELLYEILHIYQNRREAQ